MGANFVIRVGPEHVDSALVYSWISTSYWANGLPESVFEKSLKNSICFSAFSPEGRQVGFARVISDHATFAYLCDVFVDESVRGQGVGKSIMDEIHQFEALKGLRRWMLATRDAHQLYKKYDWKPLPDPDIFMQLHNPDVYR